MARRLILVLLAAMLVACGHPNVGVDASADASAPHRMGSDYLAWGGDLAGSTNVSQGVVSLTGSSGTVGLGSAVTTFTENGTGPASGTANGLTWNLQTPNASNGSAGSFVVDLQQNTGSGTEGSFQVNFGSTDLFQINTGGHGAGGTSSYSNINFFGNTFFSVASGGLTVTSNNSTLGLVSNSNYGVGINAQNVTIGSPGAITFGTNSQLGLGVANDLADPTGPPTGGGQLWENTTTNAGGLHYAGPSTPLYDYMIGATLQGTADVQQGKSRLFSGFLKTTSATATTILTIPLVASSTAQIWVTVVARCVSGGGCTAFDGFQDTVSYGFKCNATPVCSAAGSIASVTVAKTADTSMASCAISTTISSPSINVQVAGLASATIDWTAEARAIIN